MRSAPKPRLNALSAPGVMDDADAGYSIGSTSFDAARGKVYQCADTTPGAARWPLLNPSYTVPAGGYIGPEHVTNIGAYQQVAADRFYFVPFLIREPFDMDLVHMHIDTAGSANARMRLGMYYSRGGLPYYPYDYFYFNEWDVSTAGDKDFYCNIHLDPGVWWLAMQFNSTGADAKGVTTPKFSGISSASLNGLPYLSAPPGGSASVSVGSGARYYSVDAPYANGYLGTINPKDPATPFVARDNDAACPMPWLRRV